MRQRRNSDTDDQLLDEEDGDNSSSSSEPGNCNWKVLTGIFIVQLVITGVLASYGVLLLSLVEAKVVSLRYALWTPITHVASRCFADALCKTISERRETQASRFLASAGILMVTGGLIVTSLLQDSHLQFLGYGLLGGVGTSLVLTQADIVRHSHYPRGSHSAAISHLVPYLGAPVGQFSMPLLFLGFLSLYETREALLLQAGVVLHGLVGIVILHSPNLRPPTFSRYRSRPRAFTFVNDESVYTSSSNGNSRDSYTGRNSLLTSFYGRNWRNPSSCNNHPKLNNWSGEQPVFLEISPRCNKNGVEILPEIPEESEEGSNSDCSDNPKDVHAESYNQQFTDKVLNPGTRSVDGCLDANEVSIKLIDSFSENRRWSIGTVEAMVPVCVENGLTEYRSVSDSDEDDEENKSVENIVKNSKIEKEEITESCTMFPVNCDIWRTRSLVEVGPKSERTDLSDFDPVLSKRTEIQNIPVVDSVTRNVRSLNSIFPGYSNVKLKNQISLQEDSSFSNVNTVSINSSGKLNGKELSTPLRDKNIKQLHDMKHIPKRWSTGTFEQILRGNSTSSDEYQGLMLDSYRKWHSAELRESVQSRNNTDSSCRIKSDVLFTTEVPDDPTRINADVANTDETCEKAHEVAVSVLGPRETEQPLWTAKLMCLESFGFDITSSSYQGSNLLSEWSQCPSSLSRLIQRLIFSCSCHFQQCCVFRRQYSENFCNQYFWHIAEYAKIPYIFPSLLLQFTLRLCPMGFAVLSPLLVTRLIDDCTNGEAVFSVSISGFVWLCFLLVIPWCSKMSPSKYKYLFAAGNVVSACGLHFLSKAESHDKMALSCAIFGLGLGATMVMGNTTMYDALGAWNFAKVNVILDFISGVLVLVAGSVMTLLIDDQEGLSSCFTLMAVLYLVTGISWLLRPFLNILCCQHHIKRILSCDGRHMTSR